MPRRDDGPPESCAGATFNEMADRLDELVKSQRSLRRRSVECHQLRTPMTALRCASARISQATTSPQISASRDAALQRPRGSASHRRSVGSCAPSPPTPAPNSRRHRRAGTAIGCVGSARRRTRRRAAKCSPPPDRDLAAMFVSDRLEQILDNLIDNAASTAAGGSGRAQRPPQAPNSRSTSPARARHGRRKSASEPSTRSGRANGHSNGSTGLGLAIVDQLVRTSSGTITLEPNLAASTFPLSRSPPTVRTEIAWTVLRTVRRMLSSVHRPERKVLACPAVVGRAASSYRQALVSAISAARLSSGDLDTALSAWLPPLTSSKHRSKNPFDHLRAGNTLCVPVNLHGSLPHPAITTKSLFCIHLSINDQANARQIGVSMSFQTP